MQNLNNTPTLGPLMADDFDHEPWHLPAWTAQTDAERGYHLAAEAATELCDDNTRTVGDAILNWLTPRRFWALYVSTLVGAMLGVWGVLS